VAVPDLSWLTPSVRQVQADHRRRVAALYRGDPVDRVVAIAGRLYGGSHGLHGTNEIDMLEQPRAWLADVLADMAASVDEFADPVTFRPPVVEIDPLGVHFIDALLGARTYIRSGQMWSDPLSIDPAELTMPDLAQSETLGKALRLAGHVVEATQGRLPIALPVFSCPINVGINLFGDRLLTALCERPAQAKRALRIITDVILGAIDAFAQAVSQRVRHNSVACTRYAPAGYGQIDGCATQLVSGRHYAEFFAPLDDELLRAWPRGGMIHLCGAHGQHYATWREMRSVRSIQVNDRASEDLVQLVTVTRDDQILYVSPTETMPVDRVLQIAGGRRLVLQCAVEHPMAVGA